MPADFYGHLETVLVSGGELSRQDCLRILDVNDLDTMELVGAASRQRNAFFGKLLSIHMINNAQNGACSEDCRYCVQSKVSTAKTGDYGSKAEEGVVREALAAYEAGATCYGIVFSGRALLNNRLQKLASIVRRIKEQVPLKVCVSVGFVNRVQADVLKSAGVDRLHHNLNTSEGFYSQICTTHAYADRVETINAAKSVGLPVCSGLIVGMGEKPEDVVSTALRLKELNVACVPVNFYIPLAGTALGDLPKLSVDYCLRVLCLFRLVNPRAELCLAAGRELYLQTVQPLVLSIVDGIFMNGYLNVQGDKEDDVLKIAQELGFSLVERRRQI
ncbi:MAG: biotin synthase BioB [Desulfobulbaceae bacterium]|nr:biotin synthase BioB [Desulfobulbaceae bacterium]